MVFLLKLFHIKGASMHILIRIPDGFTKPSAYSVSPNPQRLRVDKYIWAKWIFMTLAAIHFLIFSIMMQSAANAFTPFRIGTGGETGVYHPIGKLLASGITLEAKKKDSPLDGYIGVAQNSAGSIENIKGVESGLIEAGMAQADIASFAYNREKMFAGADKPSSIRAIASLYPEKFHIVVRTDAGISHFTDLKGKRISIDEEGSGTLAVMRIILQAYNLSESDLSPVYLKPMYTHGKMKNGDIQGFVSMAGAPMDAVSRLLETGVTLISLDQKETAEITRHYPYLFPGKIEAGIYPEIPTADTLEAYALLVVDEQMPNDVAYAITEALFDRRTTALLREGHPQGVAITQDTALNGVSIPLHPGAEQFYKGKGIFK